MTTFGTAVSDQGYSSGYHLSLDRGRYFAGLTFDDAGGLRYLLCQTNINLETLNDSVFAREGNTDELVRTACRPGVEKVVLVRHLTSATGGFVVMTNEFDDLYVANEILHTQQVCRVVSQPDILFRVRDFGCAVATNYIGQELDYLVLPVLLKRTDTARWINNANLNGNPDGDGPGVIRPPIEITFHTPGRYLAATGGSVQCTNYWFWNWASFSGPASTNVTVFPGNQTNLTSLTLATRTFVTNASPTFEWTLLGRPGKRYRIEAATNLADWSALATVTNLGGVFQFTHPLAQPRQFFRAVLEE